MLNYMLVMIKSFIGDEEGASAVEYGLIVALIAVLLIGVLALVGGGLEGLFDQVVEELPTAGP
jgi:pilus assembly protein Flp/PilA